jgi:glucosylglycerate synthase
MIAIGIPTYNEADNIATLVRQIDAIAAKLQVQVTIMNADNSSADGTADIFNATDTHSPKVGLTTKRNGKGSNLFAIFEYVLRNDQISHCMLVDGDVTTLGEEWLINHLSAYNEGADYVVPNYSRKYIEGNATNHFAYPIMRALLNGPAPNQPLAGDIGLSKRLIEYLLKQPRPAAAYGYGIDMFIAAYAASYEGTIREVMLDKKLHKPSFGKMVTIFQETAAAYFAVLEHGIAVKAKYVDTPQRANLLASSPIPQDQLTARLTEARKLYRRHSIGVVRADEAFKNGALSTEGWVNALAVHHQHIGRLSADRLAWSLTPFYLLRSITYLKSVTTPADAATLIDSQADIIQQTLSGLLDSYRLKQGA